MLYNLVHTKAVTMNKALFYIFCIQMYRNSHEATILGPCCGHSLAIAPVKVDLFQQNTAFQD